MEEWLTISTAARILGVAESTVRQMERRGRLPAIRTETGVRLFRRGDCERIRLGRLKQATPEAGRG
jgi:excisionase family DNA binding protein